MDLRMPLLDGYQAIQHIRTREATPLERAAPTAIPRTKIIALTASPFQTTPMPLLTSGCDDILYKPCKASLLITKIAHHLGISNSAAIPASMGASGPAPRNTLRPAGAIAHSASAPTPALPTPWLTDLHTAAQRLNADRCFKLIEQLPKEYDNLANRLAALVHDFEFDAVINIIQALPRSDSPGTIPPL